MALERLPQRFLNGRTARAVTSPSAVLLAGVGASAAIVAGLPLALAAAAGAGAWALRVAIALPRRTAAERIDARSLGAPWRQFVEEALGARSRFDRAVRATEAGPLRDRLAEIGDRIQTGVQECWQVARRANGLVDAYQDLDVEKTRQELAVVERDLATPGGGSGPSLQRTAEALRAQLSSADRLARVANEARDRLRLLDARLDEAVARAVELSLQDPRTADTGGLGSDVDQLVGEMEALRSSLEETAR